MPIFTIFCQFQQLSQAISGKKIKINKNCRITFQEKSIKSKYTKKEVFNTNIETPEFFFLKSKLKI